MEIIGTIHTAFPQKFGIPRQSGLVDDLRARVVLQPPYNDPNAVRGLEDFSHIWLIWGFDVESRNGADFSPTVRPPRLGGEERLGVFATRSPFRPNALGLSCVRLVAVEQGETGPELVVAGADLRDGTAIYDIKPYVPLTDCRADAIGGFTETREWVMLAVDMPAECAAAVPAEELAGLLGVLAQDPRPAYQHDAGRVYHMSFSGLDVAFSVDDETGILHVTAIRS